ncbi:RNA polymerase sigma factor [Clostridium paraputrificum]|uniref:RNA polymerase sigma factor n=1 Tax=Clostridium TaxID=1485 RepID=UPI003D35372D
MINKSEDIIAIKLDDWLVKSKDGDDESLGRLYSELKRPIFVLALSIVNDYQVAEDILQETFIKIMNNSEGYKKGSNAKAWIMTIARNISLNHLKKVKREEIRDDLAISGDGNFTEEVESTMEFLRLIEELNQEEKEIVALRLSAGISHMQISKLLNISLLNVRAKYSRAIKKLKKVVK